MVCTWREEKEPAIFLTDQKKKRENRFRDPGEMGETRDREVGDNAASGENLGNVWHLTLKMEISWHVFACIHLLWFVYLTRLLHNGLCAGAWVCLSFVSMPPSQRLSGLIMERQGKSVSYRSGPCCCLGLHITDWSSMPLSWPWRDWERVRRSTFIYPLTLHYGLCQVSAGQNTSNMCMCGWVGLFWPFVFCFLQAQNVHLA